MSRHPASFRDPSGFLFEREGVLYRQVNRNYRHHYRRLMDSGMYDELVQQGLLVAHREADIEPEDRSRAHAVLRPDRVPFISYPYEWSFDALRDAALLTLRIQERALEHDMILKDASAFNVQFEGARPVFIDTLSFEIYEEGRPWPAYRQFCQHFLAPLALMARVDVGLGRLLLAHIDGIPLSVASRTLPLRSWLSLSTLLHIHLHAAGQSRLVSSSGASERTVSRRSLQGLVDSLASAVRRMRWKPQGEWRDYYDGGSYTSEAFTGKKRLVGEYLRSIDPETVWDLGSNVGVFSRMAAEDGARVISVDADPACVQLNYRENADQGCDVLPLWVDLCNPSPDVGWANRERDSLASRGPADAVMALALVHHLAIGSNVPLPEIAEYFALLGRDLIVEFVPKEDPRVRTMLGSREDIFSEYHRGGFEEAFRHHFEVQRSEGIPDSERILYLMRGRHRT
ncbi:MAG: SAM-dependent methyltransferase [Bacillota bacterium]